jgi:PPOX class probable F420-dependent enzyme
MEIGSVIPPGQDGAFQVGERTPATGLGDLPAGHRRLLDEAVTATMATLNASGTAQLTPVWVGADETHVLLNSARGRLKDRNLRARPQVTLLFVDPANPYFWMSIAGEVDEIVDEDDPHRGQEATDSINAMSALYLGQDEYPLRDGSVQEVRSLYRVTPTKIVLFGDAS